MLACCSNLLLVHVVFGYRCLKQLHVRFGARLLGERATYVRARIITSFVKG
jgi:hypothetical protein